MGLGTSGGGMVIQNISAGAQFGQTINSGDPLAIVDAGLNYMDEVETALDKPDVPKTPDVHPLDEGVTGDEELIDEDESDTQSEDAAPPTSEGKVEFAKAKLINVLTDETYPVLFNPKTISIDSWAQMGDVLSQKGYTSVLNFSFVRCNVIKLTLFYDTSDSDKNVMDYVNEIVNLQKPMMNEEKKEWRDPIVCFCWGETKYTCVIRDVNVRYTKFAPSGIPVRAYVDLIMLEKGFGALES